ncbi:CoA-binding protein [Desulfallas sp. Bu1-1]|uniref:CoA-binding protein n=1 Tax=Desulfallas sp. Bu1-1 TaxID=2787620 RepID=UPI00189FFCC7|nr:CoA-binding protein [Desulfallas sp. Bu1-1]MBF7083982.1 CoA-binding protein [Desulfallas sp. Bu1-1]
MENYSDLELFVNPQSVALVGASTRTGPGSFNVLERMLESGYRGEIYPVNPRGGSIMGVPAYRSVQEIKAPVDLAIVATPRTAVPEVVRQCVVKCIRAIIRTSTRWWSNRKGALPWTPGSSPVVSPVIAQGQPALRFFFRVCAKQSTGALPTTLFLLAGFRGVETLRPRRVSRFFSSRYSFIISSTDTVLSGYFFLRIPRVSLIGWYNYLPFVRHFV